MKKTLPIYKIEGKLPFYVDVDLGLLRSVHDPAHFIEFGDMIDKGTHYEIDINMKTGIADLYGVGGRGLVTAKIPPMVRLDPEGMAAKYNMKVRDLPVYDHELKMDPVWYNNRKLGALPTMKILGQLYFVNVRLGQLEPKNLWFNPIRLEQFRKDPTNTFYYGMLDKKSMALIAYDEGQILDIPKGAVLIRVPHERVLDPFIHLRYMGWEDHPERIGKFPVRFNMEAMELDWNQSPIPRLIEENRRQLEQKTGVVKKPRKSKGMGR
ncbi:hypothetical protein [Edaphocola aurantiacus]|uniref:hypothetical protein n=1 Tax=Edaphocola aurantiacus TaxID=2601682 RepID=UPI001C97CA15|nr:hypothetical protein [Edaphocola aurantiacus]